jgi:hypothetical protein
VRVGGIRHELQTEAKEGNEESQSHMHLTALSLVSGFAAEEFKISEANSGGNRGARDSPSIQCNRFNDTQ